MVCNVWGVYGAPLVKNQKVVAYLWFLFGSMWYLVGGIVLLLQGNPIYIMCVLYMCVYCICVCMCWCCTCACVCVCVSMCVRASDAPLSKMGAISMCFCHLLPNSIWVHIPQSSNTILKHAVVG